MADTEDPPEQPDHGAGPVAPPGPDEAGPGARGPVRGLQVAVAVLAVLLVAAVVAIVVIRTSDDGSDVASDEKRTTTTTSPPDSSMSEPFDVDCQPTELLAAIPADVLADGARVVDEQCAPAPEGSTALAFAWAQVDSPGVEPLTAFFAGRAAADPEVPNDMDWTVLTYGTDVTCDDEIPAETCDLLPGAPRSGTRGGGGAARPSTTAAAPAPPDGASSGPSPGSTGAATGAEYRMQCTASDLLQAVPPDVLAADAQVSAFACTPSSLEGADSAWAFLRAEAPGVDPVSVLFTATALVEPGSPTVVDWDAVAWGSSLSCREHMPAEACDQLPGVPGA